MMPHNTITPASTHRDTTLGGQTVTQSVVLHNSNTTSKRVPIKYLLNL